MAEDLVQEAFSRAYRQVHTFKGNGAAVNVEGWLRRIAKNLCLDELRRRRTRVRHPAAGISASTSLPADSAAMLDEALTFIGSFEESYRICYLLFVVDGFSYQEIVSLTGYDLAKVKTAIRTVRRRLATKYPPDGSTGVERRP